MKVLLDAHALLWFLAGSSQLSTKALACIHASNTIFVSPSTLWEIGIKQASRLTQTRQRHDEFCVWCRQCH